MLIPSFDCDSPASVAFRRGMRKRNLTGVRLAKLASGAMEVDSGPECLII